MTSEGTEYRQAHTIHLIGNAHIDPVWLWRWTEGFSEVKATFRSALDRLKEFPDFIFTCAGACYYQWIEENCPEMFEEIRERVREGRWAIVNGWWIQPDCNIPCGESFARQSLYSQRYYLEKFGKICDVGYNVDSFGHSGMLPQILKKSGMDGYVFMRPSEVEKPGVPNVFRWESADGSSVLTFHIPVSYNLNETAALDSKISDIVRYGSAQDSDMMLFYGVGNHGGGPTISVLNRLTDLQQQPGGESLVFSSPSRFMDAIRPEAEKYPILRDDLQIHAIGCYSAFLKIKQLNRQAETRLLTAERFDALAHSLFHHPARTAKLKAAWEKVMFNQFHDILCGCCIQSAYNDAMESFGYSLTMAGEVQNSALQRMSWAIDTLEEDHLPCSKEEDWKLWGIEKKGTPFIVFNPLPFEVITPVEASGALASVTDAGKKPLAIQQVRSQVTNGEHDKWNTLFLAKLPALGYSTFWLHKGTEKDMSAAAVPAVIITEDGRSLSNDFVTVSFDTASGTISDIFDKRLGVSVMKGPGAAALVIDETHSDTWGHGLREYRDVVGCFACRRLSVIEQGPVRVRLRGDYVYNKSSMTLDFLLYNDRPELEIRMKVHWLEKHRLLKMEFPILTSDGVSTAEIPYGTIQRPMDGTEKPIQRWIDVSGGGHGVAVINDSSYAADVKDDTIRLTLLRSPVFADHFGVRDSLCEYMEQGEHKLKVLLVPHGGDWREGAVTPKAAAFNMPPSVLYETYHKGSLPQTMSSLRVSPGTVFASAFKVAEDGTGTILRCHETTGEAASAELSVLPLNRSWSASFGPFEIKTFFIPNDECEAVREVNLLEL